MPLIFPLHTAHLHLPPRIVPDQDDHVMCQMLCDETTHCVGYTFVKVAFRVVVFLVLVTVFWLYSCCGLLLIVMVLLMLLLLYQQPC